MLSHSYNNICSRLLRVGCAKVLEHGKLQQQHTAICGGVISINSRGVDGPAVVATREKHSSTQIKRLFRKNPARLRYEARMGIDRTPEPLPPPKYQPVFEPRFLENGWSAPPPPDAAATSGTYPFQVHRTKNKPNSAVGFLPVYAKFRKDGTKATTLVKKVTGDRNEFLSELRSVLQLPQPKNQNYDSIRIRVGGAIEVEGNRVREIKHWLAGLGF